MDAPDLLRLPGGLPAPADDGAASHLPGRAMPALSLPATDGRRVALDGLGSGRTVIYVYPMTGRPGVDLPPGWDDIPGARGCTPESCGFRDHHAELLAAGADQVYGLSTFSVDGMTLYRRLTMIVTNGVIEHVFYPVFPPDQHARQVLDWLQANR